MKEIQFFCEDEDTAKYFAPVPAKKKMPDWYRAVTKYVDGRKTLPTAKEQVLGNNSQGNYLTVKNCIPVQDYLTSGYIISAPNDILITPSKDENNVSTFFWWSSSSNSVGEHGRKQCPVQINNEKNAYIKFLNPWGIKTPAGYSCFFYQPEYFFEDRFQLFPAIVDTDAHTSPVSFPGVITTKEDFKIEAGTPLMAVFPFKRDAWSSTVKVEKPKKFVTNYLEQAYLKLFHSKKTYN